MLKVICFDLDDTLWDPRPAFVRAEAVQYAWIERHAPRVAARHSSESLRALRLELAARRPEIAHDFTRLRVAALAEQLSAAGYDPALAPAGVAAFVRERSRVELYADALPALRLLAQRYVLVALTNGNADLEVAGVAAHFAACVSPAESGVRKPDPGLFHAGLAAVGAVPTEAVHVGDHPLYDIEGAHRAGLRAIWLNRDGSDWPAAYAPAHAQITSLVELPAALARLSIRSTH